MIFVVGSGPAGVSCAMALLQKGARVTLLDCGLELEDTVSTRVNRLKSLGCDNWQPEDVAFLKEGSSAGVSGIPFKYAYGSDFPYRDPGVDWRLKTEGVDTRPSFAKGGLSTVWGAAVLPYRAQDIQDWPIKEHELAAHYKAVFQFMPLAGANDSLEQLFPMYSEDAQPVPQSQQAKDFLCDLDASAAALQSRGILFGRSRLAVRAAGNHGSGCCCCKQCMYGCPFGAIYCSSFTLDLLRQYPNFTYVGNVAVDRLEECNGAVSLIARNLITGGQVQFSASRVFLACGVLATTKILLESLEAFDHPVTLRDSFYFLLPLLRWRGSPGAASEPLHTLAQIFLEIVDPQTCSETIHLQVYTYNELYAVALNNLFGPAYRFLPVEPLLSRLLMIQGYLPSSFSPEIRVVLCRNPETGLNTLKLSAFENERTRPILQKVVGKLRNVARLLRAIPVSPMLRPGQPGRGFHSGGTFPMRRNPDQFETDTYGRPYGFERVHAVDATIFPSIPATTITLAVMANAHRIGSALGTY